MGGELQQPGDSALASMSGWGGGGHPPAPFFSRPSGLPSGMLSLPDNSFFDHVCRTRVLSNSEWFSLEKHTPQHKTAELLKLKCGAGDQQVWGTFVNKVLSASPSLQQVWLEHFCNNVQHKP